MVSERMLAATASTAIASAVPAASVVPAGLVASAAGQQAEGALLLEVQGAPGGGGDAAEAAAEVRDRGADRRLGQHPQAERQRRRADVVAALELQRGGDRLEVRLTELPVRWPVRRYLRRPRQGIADLRQEAEILAVAEHASRRAEPPGGLRDAHAHDLNTFMSRRPGK